MVFKKPYAFLIKHFKLLHLILSGLMIYLSIKINLITNLFNKLANGVSVSLVSLSENYISAFMYLVIIFILVLGFVIWFLMNNKKKPSKYYVFLIAYYIILLVFLIIYGAAMNSIETTAMTNESLRVYRDIALLLPLGQYYFILIAILRGIGFNIKQFNFSKDIKDLEVSDKDSEEIEVNLSNNVYKYERAGRKYLRELRYYFFENKFWILILLSVILFFGIIYFFVNYKFVNNNYGEGNFVNAGNYSFQVNKTFIADKDLYGQTVQNGKKYVIVDLSIRNIYYENISLDTKKFRLFIGDDFYYSITNKNSDFKDLGLPYDNAYLDLENIYNYILIYEIDEDTSVRNLKLKVYDKLDYETNKVNSVNINLKPEHLTNEIEEKEVKLHENIVIDNEQYGTTNFMLKKYATSRNYEYSYEICVLDDCSWKTGVISPNNILKNKLIEIDYTLSIDQNSNLYKFVKNDSSFYNTFMTLTYTLNGNEKNMKFNSISNSNVNDKIFMEVSREIEDADEIVLEIHTRKVKYIYKLK